MSEIAVNRTDFTATILAKDERVSEFGKPKSSARPVLNVWSRLPGELVSRIASDLAAISKRKWFDGILWERLGTEFAKFRVRIDGIVFGWTVCSFAGLRGKSRS